RDQTSVAKGSRKLFTQKSFYDANKYVFGSNPKKQDYDKLKKFLIEFWDTLSKNVVGWETFLDSEGLDTDVFRNDNLSHLSVTMHAFGMVASRFYHQGFSLSRLSRMRSIDFSRNNSRLLKKYTSNDRLAN